MPKILTAAARALPLIFWWQCVSSVPPLSAADKPAINLETLKLPEGEVRFVVWIDPGDNPSEKTVMGRENVVGETTDRAFRVYLDLESGTSQVNSTYHHVATACSSSSGAKSCIGFNIISTPIGSFPDSWRDVSFDITENGAIHKGQWKIPVHSFANTPVLTLSQPMMFPIAANIGAETPIKIALHNPLDDSIVAVDRDAVVVQDSTGLWSGTPIELLDSSKTIMVNASETKHVFTIKVRPNFLAALMASMVPVQEDKPHTTLTVLVKHHVESGGHDRTLEVELPIRFVPSFWSLFATVILGSALGVMFCLVLPGGSKPKVSANTFLAAGACSIVAEALSIVFVAGGSKIVLFKQELNPSQLLTVFLIGFGSGLLVVWRSDAIRNWFGRALGDVDKATGKAVKPKEPKAKTRVQPGNANVD